MLRHRVTAVESLEEEPMGSGTEDLVTMEYPTIRSTTTETIRNRIINGAYPPGARLIEHRLATEFGTSRNPVRESLRVLETEGLVETTPRHGTVVSSFTTASAEDMFDVREVLEPLAARLAVERGDAVQDRQLSVLVGDIEVASACKDEATLARLHRSFHELLIGMAKNESLTDALRPLQRRTQRVVVTNSEVLGSHLWQDHISLANAVLEGDVESASNYALRHVASARRAYLRATS